MSLLVYVSDVAPYADGGTRRPAGVHQSLGSAARAFEQIASMLDLDFHHCPRAADANLDLLAEAAVLALFTIGETPWSAEQRQLIEGRAVEGALGVVGVHSATDAAYGWPAYGRLLGARFDGHPVTGELPITVLDAHHPATAHLPSPWRFNEELYLFRQLVDDAHLLLGVEMGTNDDGSRAVLPIAWCIEAGRTRTFYTVLGHFVAAYEDGAYLAHLHGGVEWVLHGDRGSGDRGSGDRHGAGQRGAGQRGGGRRAP